MVRYQEWMGWLALQRQQHATTDECIQAMEATKKWSAATQKRVVRSLALIDSFDECKTNTYINAYLDRVKYRELRETGKAGNTSGIITTTNSLPNSVLQSGDESLLSEYNDLLQVYIDTRSTHTRSSGHSYATTHVMMHFFHACLGSRQPLFSEIRTVAQVIQLYVDAYHQKLCTLLQSTIRQHCNRLLVLWQCVCRLNGLQNDTNVQRIRSDVYAAIEARNAGKPRSSPPTHKAKRCCFTSDEILQLYNACANIIDKLLLTLLLTTGLRVGGAARCQLQNIYDFEKKVAKTKGHTIEKGGVCREFYICQKLRSLINAYVTSLWPMKPRFLFPARHHFMDKCCTTAHLQVRFQRLLSAANIQWKAHIHCTRHTLIAALRMENIPSSLIQMFVGHKNIRTTDCYGILSTEQLVTTMQLPWRDDDTAGAFDRQLLHVLDGSTVVRNESLDTETLQILEQLVHNQRRQMHVIPAATATEQQHAQTMTH